MIIKIFTSSKGMKAPTTSSKFLGDFFFKLEEQAKR
jgi:hypothetical protein